MRAEIYLHRWRHCTATCFYNESMFRKACREHSGSNFAPLFSKSSKSLALSLVLVLALVLALVLVRSLVLALALALAVLLAHCQ